eukprot:2376081-Amphidinium_carterae.1
MLQLKVLCLMSEHSVEWRSVWNLDETSVRLSPNPLTGLVANLSSKLGATVTLMVCAADAPGLSQIMFAGATRRVLPTGPLPEYVQ